MDINAIARNTALAGSYEEPAARQLRSLLQLRRLRRLGPPPDTSRTPFRTPSRRATRKRMLTDSALCHSDRASGWHQHSGMMPSGRLQSWQCWRLCRQI